MFWTRLVGILALIFLAVFFAIAPAESRTWYVLPDGSGDAPTIQAAIDSCSHYDTVLIAAGTYAIDSDGGANYFDGLYLIGEAGAEQTVLDAGGQPYRFAFLYFFDSELELTIKGLTFQFFGGSPLYISGLGGRKKTLVIEECIFRYNGDYVMNIIRMRDVVIQNNLIYSNEFGIRLHSCGLVNVSHNTIAYTIQAGLEVPASIAAHTVSNNIIVNNYYSISGNYHMMNFSCNNVFDNFMNYNLPGGVDPTGFDGNISVDPQFCSATPRVDGNFYLQSDSPCAPGNHPAAYPCGQIGVYPVGCSLTAVETKSWGAIKNMYR